jgi:hypothetical protein
MCLCACLTIASDALVCPFSARPSAVAPLNVRADDSHSPNECPERFKTQYANCSWCTDVTLDIYGMVAAMDESLGNITAALLEVSRRRRRQRSTVT